MCCCIDRRFYSTQVGTRSVYTVAGIWNDFGTSDPPYLNKIEEKQQQPMSAVNLYPLIAFQMARVHIAFGLMRPVCTKASHRSHQRSVFQNTTQSSSLASSQPLFTFPLLIFPRTCSALLPPILSRTKPEAARNSIPMISSSQSRFVTQHNITVILPT